MIEWWKNSHYNLSDPKITSSNPFLCNKQNKYKDIFSNVLIFEAIHLMDDPSKASTAKEIPLMEEIYIHRTPLAACNTPC